MSKQYVNPKSKDVQDELSSIGSALGKLQVDKTYDVPDDFFDRQRETILATYKTTSVKSTHVAKSNGSAMKYIKMSVGIAASLALLLTAYQINTGDVSDVSGTSVIADIDATTLEEYLMDQVSYLDTDIAINRELIELIED